MLRPNAHLRDLMLRATTEQAERAMGMAKKYVESCRFFAVDPGPPEKVLIEAFDVVLRGNADVGDVGDVAKNDFYTRRQYGPRYTER